MDIIHDELHKLSIFCVPRFSFHFHTRSVLNLGSDHRGGCILLSLGGLIYFEF